MKTPTLIIGAGPAGLAAAACLTAKQQEHVVVDAASDIAWSWRNHYRRLHLHTSKDHSGLPLEPFPKALPRYPSRDEVVSYLEGYAAKFDIRPRLGCRVTRLDRGADGFVAHLDGGEEITAKNVVVASGYNRVPRRPAFTGIESFGGSIRHSSEYSDGTDYAGRDVLVVGCGNSGAEIAIDLWEFGARPMLVIRGPVHVQPRDFLGVSAQEASLRMARLPLVARDAIALGVGRLLYSDLARYGIERPKKGPISMVIDEGRVPMLDIGTADLIRQGAIRVVPGVRELAPDSVRFADGREEHVDDIVLATGFDSGLRQWVSFADAVLDDRDLPRHHGDDTVVPGAYFVGFRNPPTGAFHDIAAQATRVATSIASR